MGSTIGRMIGRWVGRWQKPTVKTWSEYIAMPPVVTHTMAYATLVGHSDVQSAVRAILYLLFLTSALHWHYCFSYDFGGLLKCPSDKQTS